MVINQQTLRWRCAEMGPIGATLRIFWCKVRIFCAFAAKICRKPQKILVKCTHICICQKSCIIVREIGEIKTKYDDWIEKNLIFFLKICICKNFSVLLSRNQKHTLSPRNNKSKRNATKNRRKVVYKKINK